MKFHNPLEIASNSTSPILFISIALTVFILIWLFLSITMPYGFAIIPIAAIVRVAYALVKGK
jgi:hypothetical protein